MCISSRLLVSLAVASCLPATAVLAADYDPPIYVEEAPEFVPVEIGSGWYLRGDISYTFSDPVYEFTLLGEETNNLRFGGGAGFGYHFNDYLRGDLTVSFLGRDSYAYDDGFDSGSASHHAWSGLVNAYLDLGTVAGFTPYVGGGVGLLYTKQEIDIDSPTLGLVGGIDDSQYRFAYALGGGVSYKVAGNASIDVGYQYLSSPKTEYIDTDTLAVRRGVDRHQIKVGLRYDLW